MLSEFLTGALPLKVLGLPFQHGCDPREGLGEQRPVAYTAHSVVHRVTGGGKEIGIQHSLGGSGSDLVTKIGEDFCYITWLLVNIFMASEQIGRLEFDPRPRPLAPCAR